MYIYFNIFSDHYCSANIFGYSFVPNINHKCQTLTMTIVDNSTLDLQNVQNAIVENSLICCSLLPQRLVVRRSILSSERVKEAFQVSINYIFPDKNKILTTSPHMHLFINFTFTRQPDYRLTLHFPEVCSGLPY